MQNNCTLSYVCMYVCMWVSVCLQLCLSACSPVCRPGCLTVWERNVVGMPRRPIPWTLSIEVGLGRALASGKRGLWQSKPRGSWKIGLYSFVNDKFPKRLRSSDKNKGNVWQISRNLMKSRNFDRQIQKTQFSPSGMGPVSLSACIYESRMYLDCLPVEPRSGHRCVFGLRTSAEGSTKYVCTDSL